MPTELHVRGVDPDLWHQLRVEAVRGHLTLGQALNQAITHWLAHQQKEQK
jgi:hypothetical protein